MKKKLISLGAICVVFSMTTANAVENDRYVQFACPDCTALWLNVNDPFVQWLNFDGVYQTWLNIAV